MKFFTGSTIKINKGDALEFTKTLDQPVTTLFNNLPDEVKKVIQEGLIN